MSFWHIFYGVSNPPLKHILSRVAGKSIFQSFYSQDGRGMDWNGKKAAFTLSFDFDNRKDLAYLPETLEVLECYGVKASFACVGKFVEESPREYGNIVEKRHEIINHTYSHPNCPGLNERKYNEISFEERKEEIFKCNEVCKKLLNCSPTGFRTPHFGSQHTADTYKILEELGYTYSSSTIAIRTPKRGLPFNVGGILEIPVSICPRHPFNVFDSFHSFRSKWARHTDEEFSGLFQELLKTGIANGLLINVYFDVHDFFENSKPRVFENMLEFLNDKRSDVWVAKTGEIAEYYRGKT